MVLVDYCGVCISVRVDHYMSVVLPLQFHLFVRLRLGFCKVDKQNKDTGLKVKIILKYKIKLIFKKQFLRDADFFLQRGNQLSNAKLDSTYMVL